MRCDNAGYTIGKFFVEKNAIDINPEYQRQAGAWGYEKLDLFLHTIFASYDVPKIYLHKLPSNGGLHEFALVDGKQRLQCIWDFLDGKIALDGEFDKFIPALKYQEKETPLPARGNYYKDLSVFWKEKFKATQLSVVIIHDIETSGDDIDSLFLRLNNGEPLNAAEKRNGIGGKMCKLIRDIAKHKFFTKKFFPKDNKRDLHCDIAARFLLIEDNVDRGNKGYCIIKKKHLDDLAKDYKNMKVDNITHRRNAVNKQLNTLCRVFKKEDPLLRKEGHPQLYYLFIKEMDRSYADEHMLPNIAEFISNFQVLQAKYLKLKPEEKIREDHPFIDLFERLLKQKMRDNYVQIYLTLGEFEKMTGQANDSNSLKRRIEIMTQFFLLKHPETEIRGKERNFNPGERYAIYILGGKKCAECKKEFKDYSDFEADHIIPWIYSGDTSFSNAQALHIKCNREKSKKVA